MSKTIEFDWPTAIDMAKAVSRTVARSYPGIDADDIEQAIVTKCATNEATFKRMGYGPAAMGNIFKRYGNEYANSERLSAYNFNSEYHYTVSEVRTLCQRMLFDADAFHESFDDIPELMSRFDDIMCRVVDLQTAYNDATDADKELIRVKFLTDDEVTPAKARATQRAIDRLTLAINKGRSVRRGSHDGPGARQAISNAAAGHITSASYGG